MIEQIEILKNHSHLLTEAAEFRRAASVDGHAVQQDFSLVRRNQPVDALEEGALACPGRADENLEVAGVHGDGDIMQNGASAESFADAAHLQQGGGSIHQVSL